MYRQSKSAVGVATEDALKDDGVEWSGHQKKKKTTDKQTVFMVNPGHKNAQQQKF
jgi:hypothetical protein